MGLRISTNLPALAAQRILSENQEASKKSLTRLASGDRITSAGDDAAGLSISEHLKANIRSLKQAQRNANDGVSFVQVAEGSLGEVSNNLIRMRELSMQAASDTIGDRERSFIDQEVQQLKTEIDRVADSTAFNGTPLLNGKASKDVLDIQVGASNKESDRIQYAVNDYNIKLSNLSIKDIHVRDIDAARETMESVDGALDKVNGLRANLGAIQNRLQSTNNSIGVTVESLAAANSRVRDTDIAEESSEFIKHNILNTAGVSVLAQANTAPSLALKLI